MDFVGALDELHARVVGHAQVMPCSHEFRLRRFRSALGFACQESRTFAR